MPLKVKRFEFNMFGESAYVVYDEPTRFAAIIDPGMMNARECVQLDAYIADNSLDVKKLIATHIHVDHVLGVEHVEKRYGIKLSASSDDLFLAERIEEQVRMFHLPISMSDSIAVANILSDGEIVALGDDSFEVISLPGHSPGSIALYSKKSGVVFSGDALFQNSIGRTDLPGGNYAMLILSITDRLLSLPDSTIVYPGHGPSTTIGNEKRFNPYL